jgi:hypothetical protein
MRTYLIPVAFLLTCAVLARADEPTPLFDALHWKLPKLGMEWESSKCWGPNDYDRKSLPQLTPNCKGAVDDYCPKTCPISLGKLTEAWYSLGSSALGVGPCQRCPSKP